MDSESALVRADAYPEPLEEFDDECTQQLFGGGTCGEPQRVHLDGTSDERTPIQHNFEAVVYDTDGQTPRIVWNKDEGRWAI